MTKPFALLVEEPGLVVPRCDASVRVFPKKKAPNRTMRQPVRPFITAYKNRSSKFRMPRPRDIDDPEKAISKPMSVDLSVNAPAKPRMDAEYSAALAAADALFGGKAIVAEAVQEPSNIPTSRILPCLLQPEAQLAPPAEQAKKAGRAPRAAKPPARKAAKATAVVPPVKPAIARQAVEPPQVVVTPDTLNVPATRRERSSIQNRWVRKTELKPGEKWKHRLCKAAR
ncbi:hypothetical protein ACNHKD_00645 [Methylocystis sp. JAN1]|uniref:hypothetical protein n=1 Tax=Methylocystis sp. JAN1 TaxID=3397211 RepID=UPI003FA30250